MGRSINRKTINMIISRALAEDDARSDVTTRSLVNARQVSEAHIFVKKDAVLCGMDLARSVFRQLDPSARIKVSCKDGENIRRGETVLSLKARTRALLSGERVALNFLGYLSGIATLTSAYVQAAGRQQVQILDTRKTTPTLREFEKYAVRVGGGVNHRMSLADMVMIKDNHREVCQPEISIAESIQKVRSQTRKRIVIEVDTMAQLAEALLAGPDIILLDNMTPSTMKKAVQMRDRIDPSIPLEASGGVSLRRVKAIAQTGVERISIGALTHSAVSVDFSMEILKK